VLKERYEALTEEAPRFGIFPDAIVPPNGCIQRQLLCFIFLWTAWADPYLPTDYPSRVSLTQP